jgi:hypothetical protein
MRQETAYGLEAAPRGASLQGGQWPAWALRWLRTYRGPLLAAAAVAAFACSRTRTLAAAQDWTAAGTVLLAVLPLAVAWAERRALQRLPRLAEAAGQRLLDGYCWLAVCAAELAFPLFATRLGVFLPALGLLWTALDHAWILSGWWYRSRPAETEPDKPESAESGQRPGGRSGGTARLAAVAFLLGLAVPGLQLSGLLDRHKVFTGDEPAYLLVALSLLEDGDLRMNNQYRERQYERFGTQRYPVFAHPGLDGGLYPHHNAGLPALLVPAVAAGLGDEARLALLVRGLMALLGAWAVAETALLARAVAGSGRAGLWAAALAGLSVPLGFYGTQVYPEVPAALCAVFAYRRIAAGGSLLSMGAAGLAAGALVWLHSKFLPLLGLLALAAVAQGLRAAGPAARRLASMAAFGLCLGVPAVLFFQFVHATYGTWSPAALQLGVRALAAPQDLVLGEMGRRLLHTPLSFVGFFFDQRIGLLLYAPAFLLAVPGAVLLWRRGAGRVLELAALGLAPIALYSWFYWSMGGYGPPNRPAVPGVPFLAVLAGAACAGAGGWAARRARDVLWAPGLLLTAALLLHHDALYHPMSVRSEGARNQLVAYHGPAGFDLTELLPAYLGKSLNFWPNLLFPLAGIALLAWLLPLWRRGRRRRPAPRLASELRLGRLALAAVAALLLACRLAAVARTPMQIERGGGPEPLVLAGAAWAEPEPAVWVRGSGWARLLLPVHTAEPLELQLMSLVPNRLAVRSGGAPRVIELGGGSTARLELSSPWRLVRGGQQYVLLEVACLSGTAEPRGPRHLGVRLSWKE